MCLFRKNSGKNIQAGGDVYIGDVKKETVINFNYKPCNDLQAQSDEDKLRVQLDDLLEKTWKAHRSYKLMQTDDIDHRLFPNIQNYRQFEAKGKRKDCKTESPVWEIIRESWKESKNRTIVIKGAGGIGKTVTLFSLINIDKNLIPAPAVYVPMFELVTPEKCIIDLSDYFKSASDIYKETGEKICELAKKPWVKGPSLLILLDGFNEVPGDYRWPVLSMLQKWQIRNPGAQLIAVSRHMDNLDLEKHMGEGTIAITLSALSKQDVGAYLAGFEGENIHVPEPDAEVWNTIVYPLFLNLYVKAEKLREQQTWMNYPLKVFDASGPGSLIWNFLQREMLRENDEKWILRCTIACEYVAPTLAYHMLQNDDYTIGKSELISQVNKSVAEITFEKMPNHISATLCQWNNLHLGSSLSFSLKEINWTEFILRELGLLVPHGVQSQTPNMSGEEPRFEFLHQSFRDCLAGVYLINKAETMLREQTQELPDEWQKGQHPLALDYAAELMDSSSVENLWETNRLSQRYTQGSSQNHVATYTLLELLKRRRPIPNHINFSEMDLSGLSLTRYLGRGEINLNLFHDPQLSYLTKIDASTFESEGHTGSISCIDVFSDGRIVSGSEDCTLRVWDSTTGQCLKKLKHHHKAITCVKALKNGKVLSGSKDNAVWLSDPTSCSAEPILKDLHFIPVCITMLSDELAAIAENELAVWIYDVTGNAPVKHIKAVPPHYSIIAVFPDGKIVAKPITGEVEVFDLFIRTPSYQLKAEGHLHEVTCAITLNNGLIVTGSNDKRIRIWDTTGKCLKTMLAGSQSISCLAALPDDRIVVGSHDTSLWMLDLNDNVKPRIISGHKSKINCLAVLQDKRIVSGSSDRSLLVWNSSLRNCLHSIDTPTLFVNCMTTLKNGRLISSSTDNSLRVWDVNMHCAQSIIVHGSLVTCLETLSESRVACGMADGRCCIWNIDLNQIEPIKKLHEKGITSLHRFPDGRILSTSHDKTIRIWDSKIEKCLSFWKGHQRAVTCACILSNSVIVSGSNDTTLILWEASPTGEYKRLCALKGHKGRITCIVNLPEQIVASGSDTGEIRIWDLKTNKRLPGFSNSAGVTGMRALSDDCIVSSSIDKTLRIMNIKQHRQLEKLLGHDAGVKCITVNSDNKIISGSYDGTIRFWEQGSPTHLARIQLTEIPVSNMNLSRAVLSPDMIPLLMQNGATINNTE